MSALLKLETKRLLNAEEIIQIYDKIHLNNDQDGESFIIQATDCHVGGKYEYKNNFGDAKIGNVRTINISTATMLEKLPAGVYVVLTGDNNEIACALAENIKANREFQRLLMAKHYSDDPELNRYGDGNHDPCGPGHIVSIVELPNGRRILCTHSDLEFNQKKWSDYRNKIRKGVGLLKRVFVMPFVKLFDKIDNDNFAIDFLDRTTAMAKLFGCDGYLGGHAHPQAIIRQWHGGVETVIGPQGFNLIGFKTKG